MIFSLGTLSLVSRRKAAFIKDFPAFNRRRKAEIVFRKKIGFKRSQPRVRDSAVELDVTIRGR